MQRLPINPDWIAGLVATAAFLILFLLLGAGNLWITAALSAATYLGVRMLVPTRTASTPTAPLAEQRQQVAAIRQRSAALPTPLREKTHTVVRVADRLLDIGDATPDRRPDIQIAVGQYLALIQQGLALYASAVQTTVSASQSRNALGQLLDGVEQRLTTLLSSIEQEDDMRLAQEMSALNRTAQEIDEVLLLPLRGTGANTL